MKWCSKRSLALQLGRQQKKICPQVTRETGDTTIDLYKDIIENDTQASLKGQSQHNKGIKFSPFCQGQAGMEAEPKAKNICSPLVWPIPDYKAYHQK